ncbi:c-type cytochrome domain-containing protein [Pseudomonas cavernae]|nr:c-type cytochrome domain-containing protein [Pseudomonas cavernae]
MHRRFTGAALLALCSALLAVPGVGAEEVGAEEVLRLLQANCVICHKQPGAPLRLRLDSLEGLLRGSLNGPVVQPGRPQDSELIRRLKGLSQPRMPLTGPPFLEDEEIARIERWIAIGAPLGSAGRAAAKAAGVPPYSAAEVASLLQANCLECHLGADAPVHLRLDSLEGLLRGSENGPVVQPGRPQDSELIRRLKGISQPRMPLNGPPFLMDEEIAGVEGWIAAGAPLAGVVGGGADPAPPSARPAPGAPLTYLQVAPILQARCVKCHASQGLMGPAPEGYRLTSYAEVLASGERARVVPGSALASELVRRIRGQARPRMPHDGPPFLSDAEIGLIASWIDQGARDAHGQPAALPSGARVRLHGTLADDWRLDGLPLQVNEQTRLDKRPQPGDYVQVRGRLNADGGVTAERIRRR